MDRRLLVLALGMFALGTDSFIVAGILPQISHGFRVSPGVAGQMTTVYAVTYALMAPTIAAIAAHVPRKTLLLSSLVIFVIANLATALSPNFGFALASRVVAGIGAAMFAPTATGAASMMVPPEKRGFALAIVIAGLSASTALGSPIGAVIGGLGGWRWTMAFVSGLAVLSGLGVWALLSHIPLPPKVTLWQRIAPATDLRVALTLACTLLYQAGHFLVYTYFSIVFNRILGGNTWTLGALLVLWGVCGTTTNLMIGRLVDKIGGRSVIVVMLVVLVADLIWMPTASAQMWSAVLAIAVWGCVAWGLLAPQQHRLVLVAPQAAPVVLGLNTSCTYLGVTSAGIVGALSLHSVGGHQLGYVAVFFVIAALVAAELAAWRIRAAKVNPPAVTLASV